MTKIPIGRDFKSGFLEFEKCGESEMPDLKRAKSTDLKIRLEISGKIALQFRECVQTKMSVLFAF